MKNKFLMLFALLFTTVVFSQYRNKDGNRIGLSGGVAQTTLFTSNFDSKPATGFAGGLSVRGNYYNNWSMIYGMQFFINNFNLESTTSKLVEYNLTGAQIRLLLSYNVVKNHVSFDFGPVLQVSDKLKIDNKDAALTLKGTALKADQIVDISKINGNFYVGISAGSKAIRALVFYEYGFTNIFNKLNSQDGLVILNNNDKFKGTLGTINGQIIFNL